MSVTAALRVPTVALMITVPVLTAVTTPDCETVATDGSELLHVMGSDVMAWPDAFLTAIGSETDVPMTISGELGGVMTTDAGTF